MCKCEIFTVHCSEDSLNAVDFGVHLEMCTIQTYLRIPNVFRAPCGVLATSKRNSFPSTIGSDTEFIERNDWESFVHLSMMPFDSNPFSSSFFIILIFLSKKKKKSIQQIPSVNLEPYLLIARSTCKYLHWANFKSRSTMLFDVDNPNIFCNFAHWRSTILLLNRLVHFFRGWCYCAFVDCSFSDSWDGHNRQSRF